MHQQRHQLLGKALDFRRGIPNQLRPNEDMPQKLPLIGIIVFGEIGKLHNLPDIMQHGAGNENISIHKFIARCHKIADLRDGKRMLHQTAAEAVVHGFCRGMIFKILADDRVSEENFLQQLLDIGALYGLDIRQQLCIHFVNIFIRTGDKIRRVIFALAAAANPLHIQLQFVIKCRYKRIHLDKIILLKALDILIHIPDLRIHNACFILQF